MGFSASKITEIKNIIKDLFESTEDNTIIKNLVKDTLGGGMLKETLEDDILKETLKKDFNLTKISNVKSSPFDGVQITELPQASKFEIGDLMLVRKTSQGKDNKIVYGDLVSSMGILAINGFIATLLAPGSSTIVLTPTNGAPIPGYITGMKISFISPVTIPNNVKIQIAGLLSVNLYDYKTTTSIRVEQNDYIEAVFIDGNFSQVNNLRLVKNAYSSEYSVVLITVDPAKTFTTITLGSSEGIPKKSYYDGMLISFVTSEDTVGVTIVNIDDLGSKTIYEPNSEDYISTPIYAGQPVLAIYSSNKGGFIRNTYAVSNPKVVEPLIPDPVQPDKPIIPDKNKVDLIIGPSHSIKTLPDALAAMVKKYGPSGGGMRVTILYDGIMTDADAVILTTHDYSWVSLKAFSGNLLRINLLISPPSWLGTPIFFNVGKTSKLFNILSNVEFDSSTDARTFFIHSIGYVNLENITIITRAANLRPLNNANNGIMNITNCNISANKDVLFLEGGSVTIKNSKMSTPNSAIRVARQVCTIYIGGSDLSYNGTSSFKNIELYEGATFIRIKQVTSKAQSTLRPNAGESGSGNIYVVDGSQDVVIPVE